MYLEGSFVYQQDPVRAAKVLFYGEKSDREVILLDTYDEDGKQKFKVRSAFKQVGSTQYMALSDEAAKLTTRVNAALRKVTRSGGEATFYNDFPAVEFYSKTRNAEITVISDRHTTFQVTIDMDVRLNIALTEDGVERKFISPSKLPYVEISSAVKTEDGQEITVRTVAEIRLKKQDLSWMDKVKNVVVQDDAEAEELFKYFENYNGAIAYDTETTGLKINCFGKINSSYAKELEEYNKAHPGTPLRADKLCGIIFCNEPTKAYYFPCFSRKFKALYTDDTPTRRRVIERIRARYTVGDLHDRRGDMADFIRSGVELPPDVILMERIRDILENGYIVAHNGSYEYKCGLLYDIITNLRDDTMLLHQILYRYGPNPVHRRSDLKTLSNLELGIEQWSLDDFFPQYKEDSDSRIRTESQVGKKKKKKGAHIDFSYMELDGATIYAPADGYCTYQLWQKYKADLKANWSQMERIYLIEIAACPGVAYCEFYGHRLDVAKIESTKQDFIEQTAILESKVRNEAGFCQGMESEVRRRLELARMDDKAAEKLSEDEKGERLAALEVGSKALAQELREIMAADVFNIGSPKQLCELFYETLGIPETSKGKSVAKDAIKAILEHKNPDGSFKYPIAKFYQEYKAADTLLIKFFDNLSDYMYPGGYIFSSYGQIAAATGRMSCRGPNAQQYPKPISKIVIGRPNCVMMDADFSQIEYRVLVALAKEPGLMKAFFDPDNDYHTLMASIMYGVPYAAVTPQMRGDAKRFNFGIPYGMGIGSIAMGLFGENTPKTREMAKQKRKLYFKDQPRVEAFFERVKEAAVVYGYTETAFKRRRYYTFTSNNSEKANAAKAAAQRQAGNAVIQGCVRGDSKILTQEYGYISIGALSDMPCTVWDGTQFVSAFVRPSGMKEEYRVKFADKNEIYCSPEHAFLVAGTKGKFTWRSAKDLSGQLYVCMSDDTDDWVSNDLMLPDVCDSKAHNSRNISMGDMVDDYARGLLAGHLAGDGSVAGNSIYCLVAEHEKEDVLPVIEDLLSQFGNFTSDTRESGLGTELMYRRSIKSKRLCAELCAADIKNRIPLFVWNRKESLRGYLRARFDSDGGVNNSNVILTFGRKHEAFARDIQQALYLFGIHSRLHFCADRINVTVMKKHVPLFRDRIGFINSEKQSALDAFIRRDTFKTFGRDVVKIISSEPTGNTVEMFDVVDSESSKFMVNGLVTHNTAADIFKIAMARSMRWIVKNGLMGKVFITNMVHDELLFEIDTSCTDVLVVTCSIAEQMSFPLDGYPPLYVGAGVSDSWAKAKGKDAEIHPTLMARLTEECKGKDVHTPSLSPKEWIDWFDDRVMSYRHEKVVNYLQDEANFGDNIHPEVGNLIRLLYEKHISQEGINPKDPGADAERTLRCVEYISDKYNLNLDRSHYVATGTAVAADDAEDAEYDDEADSNGEIADVSDSDFEILDDDKVSGVRLADLIREFGYVVAPTLRVCGIDDSILTQKTREDVYGFLLNHKQCQKDDEGALEIVLHLGAGALKYTGAYVRDIGVGAEIEALINV